MVISLILNFNFLTKSFNTKWSCIWLYTQTYACVCICTWLSLGFVHRFLHIHDDDLPLTHTHAFYGVHVCFSMYIFAFWGTVSLIVRVSQVWWKWAQVDQWFSIIVRRIASTRKKTHQVMGLSRWIEDVVCMWAFVT